MEKTELDQLMSALKDMKAQTESLNSDMEKMGGPRNLGEKNILLKFLRDLTSIGSMVSQTLDNEELSIPQKITLKAMLSLLEYEKESLSSWLRR